MTPHTASARRLRRSTALAGLMVLCAASPALADVTGKVTNAAGVPVPGASISATEADGSTAGFDLTDANGDYAISTIGDAPPFVLTASYTDSCRPFGSSRLESTSGALPDGAVQNFTLEALPFCGAAFTPTGQPEATGNAWPERGQVLSPPGGVTYLRVVAASGASGFQLSLADGSVVGSGTDRTQLSLRAPAAPYNGPLNLSYTSAGAIVTVPLGTLISGPVGKTARPVGRSDLAAIVDVSGSMSGNDPTNRRKDAVNLLIDLAGQGDRLVGTGFDSGLRAIFPRTTVAGNATKARLKRAAKRKIGNFGGTDYNVGLGSAFDALSADPLDPTVPKSAIFLTDGAHSGTYDNSHLRFAFNGTATTWPVCVVQLGRTFRSSDTVRLKRIARETGGTFAKAPNNAQLENLYFQCRGRSSGATILLKRTSTFRIGQTRSYAKRVKKRQRSATFFVSWGVGRYRAQLVQPGGKVYRRSAGKRVRFVSGKTSQFFQVQNPKAGLWRLRVTRLKTGAVTDRATTTVTVQRRR